MLDLLIGNVYSQPGYLMWRAHQTAWRSFVEETQACGVTPVQYAILVAVCEFPSTDATRIADMLLFDKTTINDIVKRLVDKGLVERRPHATDKRVRSIYIRDAGRQIVDAVTPAHDRIADRLLAPLNRAERASLLKLLRKLVDIDEVIASTLLCVHEMADQQSAGSSS